MINAQGSPTKSGKNAFYDRYVNLLSPEQPRLKQISPSRVNSSNNLLSQLNGAPQNAISDDKENISPLPIIKNSPFCSMDSDKKKSSKQNFDIDSLSRDQKGYYEFLCRVAEVKRWIEEVIQETLPSELELCVGDSLRNGVYLAQVTQRINSDLAPMIYPAGDKLQFKHTQNINAFFSLVDHVGLPNSFRFELQDLYNKKSLPQVFETIYILITLINKKWPAKTPSLQMLSGKVGFSKEELTKCQRMWPRIRDFKSLSISPVSSPKGKKAQNSMNDSLINDFKTFNDPEENPGDLIKTPTKRASLLKPVKLPPPLENELPSNMFSPEKTDIEIKSPVEIKSSVRPNFRAVNENTLPDRSHLGYSPLKNTSLSYYSPSISKYLTYDTDFYMRRSQARERDLDYYSGFNYGPIEYSPTRKQKMTENEFLESVVNIQGICRSVNLRFNLHIKRNLLQLFGKEVIFLQSTARGKLLRRRSDIAGIWKLKLVEMPSLLSTQAVLKGFIFRRDLDRLRIKYLRQEDRLNSLQRFARGFVMRRRINCQFCDIYQSDVPLRNFQALLGGIIQRSKIFGRSMYLTDDIDPVQKIQGLCRGRILRKFQQEELNSFAFETYAQPWALQNVARGSIVRSGFAKSICKLNDYDRCIQLLSATIKGAKIRTSMSGIFLPNDIAFDSLNHLQASIRGVLVRFTLDLVDDFVEYNRLTEFQARLKGLSLRSNLRERSAMFTRNLRSIVRIQSKIRMFVQRAAYFELLQSPNPSLSCVRKFAHLLNNIGTIEEVQDKLEEFQAQLDAENMKREKLEKEIGQQIDLTKVLQKYELIDEIPAIANKLDCPNRRFPMFEKLFYLLQVDPSYWRIMYSKYPAFVENNAYCCFTTMNQKMGEREKMYFIRLVAELMQYEMVEATTVNEFLANENQLWRRFLKEFLRREYPELFELFVPLLQFVGDPNVDFESDPCVIYETIHNQEPNSRSTAIEDQHTKAKFIENLRSIWHCVEMVAKLFTRNITDFPLEVRFLATKLFSFAADKNAGDNETLNAISTVFLKCMVFEYMGNRSYFGYEDSSILQDKIKVIMDALSTVFSLEKFSGYCDPLNQYAAEMNSQIKVLLLNILLDPEYEQSGDRLIYHDMLSKVPHLEIFTDKLVKISSKLQECVSYFPDDDVLHDILKKGVESSSLPETGRVVLDLIPTSHRFLISDDRMRKVYDQVKRAFIYMMQVEEINTDLYDLALSCVLPNDEPVFKRLVDCNSKIRTDTIVRSLDTPPYFCLKNVTLKKIHEMENMELLNPTTNRLQNFLNDIANTVKSPHYAIDYVSHELEVTHKTLCGVSKINHDLSHALNELRKSNSRTVKTIQNTNKYLPIHKGPLGNLKGAYKKVQNKNGFEMDGLKYKWTTRQLYEKGVIKSIEGEKLAEQKVKVFGSSGPKFPDIIFKISTSDGSKFGIQLLDKRKGPDKRQRDSVDSFTFGDLLNTQIGSKIETWYLLNGKVVLKTSKLLNLIVLSFLKNESAL